MKIITTTKSAFALLLAFSIVILTGSILLSKHYNNSTANNPLNEKLQHFTQETKDKFKLNAIALAVLPPNQKKPISFTAGKLSKKNSLPINHKTIFKVGSITKTLIAALTSTAVKNNKIQLTDQLYQYFPEYTQWKDITIEELVNQTSGLTDYIESPNWWNKLFSQPNKIWSSQELIELAYKYNSNSTKDNN